MRTLRNPDLMADMLDEIPANEREARDNARIESGGNVIGMHRGAMLERPKHATAIRKKHISRKRYFGRIFGRRY